MLGKGQGCKAPGGGTLGLEYAWGKALVFPQGCGLQRWSDTVDCQAPGGQSRGCFRQAWANLWVLKAQMGKVREIYPWGEAPGAARVGG
jgi:hypothetical protein